MKPLRAKEKPLPERDDRVPAAAPLLFTHADLSEGLDLVGDRFRFSEHVADDEPLLAGSMYRIHRLQPGLILHCAQVRDLKDFTSQVIQQPGIKLSLLVSGATRVAYGRHHYHLGPQTHPGMANHGALVALSEPDTFQRQWRCGREERKISITLKPEWLELAGFGDMSEHRRLEDFASEHMSERAWIPSAHALLAAEHILNPPQLTPVLQNLFIQSRCLGIVVEALGLIAGPPATASLRPREQQRLQRLRELLDSGSADEWSLQRIAHHVGSNPSSLQHAFRTHVGMTIFEYQRSRRMQLAHVALCRDRLSVEEAAAIAGYTSAANFATAFKRRYGATPRKARTHSC